jgi:pyruvate/2-oxoglutarate dehydrogenase complex dihydrolipoamide dehydrogenase (E3) component
MAERFDVIVIGGGTAGLVTASGCARLGRKVALIERHALGGDCLWTGCVPTKALVATAKLAHQMRNAKAFGLESQPVRIDPKSIMSSMRAARHAIEPHDAPEKFRALGIDVIEGDATLVSTDTVEVAGRRLAARDIVIATGSHSVIPPVPGLKEAGFLDHVSFLDRDDFPASVLILGGGYIGIEFAQVLRRFGCDVTVIDQLDEIVNKEDHEVIAFVGRMLSDEGIRIETSFSAEGVRTENGRKIVTVARASERKEGAADETQPSTRADARHDIAVHEIFVASGRRGNTDGLGLEKAGVRLNHSYVAVDRFLQTNVPRIWACGDVHGGMQFTHVAAYEAVTLVRNMLFPGRSAVKYDNVPWALYTDPEVGHIGMTQKEAEKAVGTENVRVYRAEMIDVDRAVVDRATAGFVKIIADGRGHILGAHAVCSHASTVIEQIVLARKKGVRVSELAQLVAAYPSLADAVQKAAAKYYEDLSDSWVGRLGKRVAAWSQ